MKVSFDSAVRIPSHVLLQELDDEAVLLQLRDELYFGLDPIGTTMWKRLTSAPSIQAAFELLESEFDVAPERLRADLERLLGELFEHGLLESCAIDS
ncbi:MAG TPA: PqqD family protein [Thermoanaerobaculia bacterium]|nr:PqqD family protein [Thermoanaerobaculia bacterium]